MKLKTKDNITAPKHMWKYIGQKLPDFYDYCADNGVKAEFDIDNNCVIIKGESRGRAGFIANKFFNCKASDIVNVRVKSEFPAVTCRSCKYYSSTSATNEDGRVEWYDYCSELAVTMRSVITCKHYESIRKAG